MAENTDKKIETVKKTAEAISEIQGDRRVSGEEAGKAIARQVKITTQD